MERLFFRERFNVSDEQKKKYIEQRNIAVTGLGRSVGTTFVAAALAFYFRDLGKQVTFTECLQMENANSFLYDTAAMDARFARRHFFDFYRKIANDESVRSCANKEAGVNWILPVFRCKDEKEPIYLSEQQRGRLLAAAKGEICIFDIEADCKWDKFFMDMDVIVVVVDPLPSKMIRSAERFRTLKKLELSGCSVVWMVNHMNRGVSLRQVKSYLKTNEIYTVPSFPEEVIYGCEYTCRFFWENEEIKKKMMEIFTKVSHFKVSL